MRLIPMTDFVLEQYRILNKVLGEKEVFYASIKYQLRTKKYAEFLKQPLKFGMFIPCDQEGDILNEPQFENYQEGQYHLFKDDKINYEKAKEKVLFEGWQYLREDIVYNHSLGIQIYIKNKVIEYIESGGNEVYKCGCVEDLVRFKPILTESLIKQIGIINNE